MAASRRALLCVVVLLMAVLGAPHQARAWIHGVAASGNCIWPTDNGCAASTTYVAVPFFQDTNVAFDSAETGQLPTSPTSGQIAARNAALHTAGANMPGMDYPSGSGNPATKSLISTFPGDANCQYYSTGAHFTGGPVLLCQPPGNGSTAPETIRNYEMSDGAGNSVEIDVKPPASGSIVPTDLWLIDLHWEVQGDGFAGTSGQPSALVYMQATGGVGTIANLHGRNLWADGNFANAPNAVAGRVGFIDDLRSGVAGTAYNWPFDCIYCVIENFGHDPVLGYNNASSLFQYSYFRNNCLSGPSYCHQEAAEYTSVNGPWGSTTPGLRSATYDGIVYITDSTYSTQAEITTPFYFSSGNNGNANFSLAQVTNSVIITNNSACTNTGPYGPNNPCVGGIQGGEGFFAIDYTTNVQTLTVANNVLDGTGMFFAYSADWNGYTPTASVSGVTMTITTPTASYNNSILQSPLPQGQYWPGMMVHDTNAADGFTDAMITGFGAYTNTGTMGSPVTSCVIGTNAGCGSMTLSVSEPTLTNVTTLKPYAGIGTVNWSNNWSIGGAYGAAVKALNFTPFGSVNNGQVPLP